MVPFRFNGACKYASIFEKLEIRGLPEKVWQIEESSLKAEPTTVANINEP